MTIVVNDEVVEWMTDSGDLLYDTEERLLVCFKKYGGLVQLGDGRTCAIKRSRKVKIQRMM